MTLKRHQRVELEKLTTNELIDYVMQLEEQFTSDSTNSSKPPSRDSAAGREKRKAKKNTSLRRSGERKPGGQNGHPGATLRPSDKPDTQIDLPLDRCPCCQSSLSERDQTGKRTKRQVFDLPKPPPLECTQYNSPEKSFYISILNLLCYSTEPPHPVGWLGWREKVFFFKLVSQGFEYYFCAEIVKMTHSEGQNDLKLVSEVIYQPIELKTN